ncbi:preprotein translocase subunit SecG [Sandaracinomonas limnophila]|jgi:preprotein translocase subunit SecG|uniref:Protein-export membrane protein SecG n=1 Tax=Sandaracinomonas limnophila TaxID=1862386 RepID=A0A437PWW2_9BACT|nr:preprotein translocase subunit SecG [Sandaracinomonas limnophila]RVU26732.1 preprotein translocase subunit SecG [Sandaracinomonas limnophila]
MFTLIISLIILFSLLLIVLILVQNPKGGGINGEFSSGGATQMFGVQKTGDLVEQLTWGFSIAILVLVLLSNFTIDKVSGTSAESVNVEKAATKTVPTAPAPTTAPVQAPQPAK